MIPFLRGPTSWVFLVLGLAFYIYRRRRNVNKVKAPSSYSTPPTPTKDATYSEESYHQIEPLTDFNLAATEPIKIRPFKPKYHLTMALENTTMSDLVAMDNTYIERIKLRKDLIENQPQDVLAVNPKAVDAILEFYTWSVHVYLPRRFPTIFTLSPTTSTLYNTITHQSLPLHLTSAVHALSLIGQTIDDDFLLLLPSSNPQDDGKYRLEAFITCFPSGFNTPKKLNLLLSEIHGPVPGYSEKLEKSMDRFFATLPVGKMVKRHNWSVTTHRRLFTFDGNHLTDEELAAQKHKENENENENEGAGVEDDGVDIEQTVLRCERQTLHRLPKTKALVFAFKTYQYGMRELRNEGGVEDFCAAIDGLGLGNVPGMTVYKRQVVWGEKVKAFLRGEIDE
ncbi:hypothetical protein BDV96DRAFT_551399 [Lophiotrema nucula]|uniref:HRQ family protein 2 n=1 Tax=Lophiotrema nucula TaxID=690887 RepID=A0A6A5YYP4_9PLEO|nr:hypothetical protein BDV96DRAFT_551399 [Lophiotrema nucula]